MKLTEKVLSELATNYVHLKELELALGSMGETKKFLKAIEKGNSSLKTLKLILDNDDERLIVQTNHNAPNYKVVAVDINKLNELFKATNLSSHPTSTSK